MTFYLEMAAALMMTGKNIGLTYPSPNFAEREAQILRQILRERDAVFLHSGVQITPVCIVLPTGKVVRAHFTGYGAARTGYLYDRWYIHDPEMKPASLNNFFTRFAPDARPLPRSIEEIASQF